MIDSESSNMRKAPINLLILRLQACFRALEVPIEDYELEQMAVLIHDTMLGQMRKFHDLDHVFFVAEPFTAPLPVLACLFHDMVYYQVDNGFSWHTERIVSNYIQIDNQQIALQPNRKDLPTWWDVLLMIFNFQEGDKPSIFGGLNEFLSAVVALHSLEKYLALEDLITIAVCIEGTVPFRGIDSEGNSHFEVTAKQLQKIQQKYQLNLTAEKIDEILYAAVAIANQDVSSFANLDTGKFLDNTWMLIYESNTALNNRESFAYFAGGYREGLMKTEGFLKHLQTPNIFHQYKSTPKQIEYARLTHQAQRNVALAREYMAAKLCIATLLEALAIESGGDAPLSMLIGMVRTDTDKNVERAEDYLPPLTEAERLPCNPKVLHLLAVGRTKDTEFDMKSSPLAAYLYEMLGTAGIVEMVNRAKEVFNKQISYIEFLNAINPLLVSRMAKACAQLAITRQKPLSKFF